ncbi:TonB-dependent receptor [Arenimonas sp. MALMAid1274]|uniref:TonB-dependent receptor n=1 Tax=Arenimonas sp. MALMAid1274 TaxID=3411630 RepID=UPI003BA288CD
MTRSLRRAPLVMAVLLALPGLALAQSQGAPADATDAEDHGHDTARTLDQIEVTATPLRNAIENLARPVDVLTGETLDARKAGTLGETLERQTGVQSSYFGAGVGRPIIRGQDGARVQVLSGGTSALDVSTVSVDHAVTIEPFLADQIEVLKGPATLLYGSGAIGGAVNVVDGRVPTAPAGRAMSGRAEIRHGSAADESTGMARLDADAGQVTFHADLFRRDSGDYRIPGYAFSPELVAEELAEGEDPDHFARGRLPNSSLTTEGGALGGSWLGDKAWFGAAASTYRTNYGIPPGAHEHEHEEEDQVLGAKAGEEGEVVRLDMRQDRFEFRGGVRGVGPLQEISYRVTRSHYEHTEFEGDEVGTVFENVGTEGRIEAVQNEINGWRGAFGLQYGHRDFEAIGDEAFVPPSITRDVGLFVLQEREFGDFKIELGARHDRVSIDPENGPGRDHNATSLAVGGLWHFSDLMHLSVNLDRAQRAPTAEELFSDGPHIATQSFEIGDATLDTETAVSGEIGLHLHQGRFEGKVSVYQSRYDDFIYLAETGLEQDELPVRAWVQGDAKFTGWEAEGTVELFENASGLWALRVFADGVDAKLDGGGRLPRIAPGRVGADLNWSMDGWRARIGAIRVADQDDVAELESATDGYTLIDAGLAYHWDVGGTGWEAFLEGRNLTDEEARVHTSYLKDFAPLPGRNLAVGLRVSF